MLKRLNRPGATIRELRKAKRLTQVALAARVGMTQSHLQSIEAGKTDPRFSTLEALLQALDQQLAVGEPLSIRAAETIDSAKLKRPRFE